MSNGIILSAILLTLVILLIYVSKFYNHEISDAAEDWAHFGTFLGGVLSPVLSFLSLLLVLVTIRQQKVSLEQTAEQTQLSFDEMTKSVHAQEVQADVAEAQLKNLVNKSRSEELVRIIREVLLDINKSLDEKVVCYSMVSSERKLKDQILEVVTSSYDEVRVEKFRKYHDGRVDVLISSVNYYCEILDKIEEVDENKIVYYYYRNKINNINNGCGIEKYREFLCIA